MKTHLKLSLTVGIIGLLLMAGLVLISLPFRDEPLRWTPVPPEAIVLALIVMATGILVALVAKFFQRLMAMVQDLHNRR